MIVQPGERIVQKLLQAIERLENDIVRVELLAGALSGFTKPIPDYDHGQTRFDLPPERKPENLPRAATLRGAAANADEERD